MTGFFRSNRGVDSDIDDTFTIMLQYSGKQRNLLVTVKTAIVTHMKDQLRFFVRGTKGTYLKVKNNPFPWSWMASRKGMILTASSSEPARKKARQLLRRDSRQQARSLASRMRASGAP